MRPRRHRRRGERDPRSHQDESDSHQFFSPVRLALALAQAAGRYGGP